MRRPAIQNALVIRLRHPGWWSAAVALTMFPCLFTLLVPSPHTPRLYLSFGLLIPVLSLGIFLCPVPWQWSSDDRPLAAWWRGLLQLLVFALLLGSCLSPMGWVAGKASAGESFRLGMIMGLSIPFLLLLGPAGWIVARAERLAQETREAQAKARECQWMSHRGAISPRLLFSNLNHLATLAEENTRSAEQGLVDLAALYRRWLVEAELPLVPLSLDRSLTEQYLSLERSRWGSRLTLRWQFSPDLDGIQVPPLFLQPLLEAILDWRPEGNLDVDLRESWHAQGFLEVLLSVQGPVVCPDEAQLQPLRQRLQSTLGREADVTTAPYPGGWQAALRLPTSNKETNP